MYFPPRFGRLPPALLLSVLLHAVCLTLPGMTDPARPSRPPPLEARLMPPADLLPAENLLKNTMTEQEAPKPAVSRPSPPAPDPAGVPRMRKAEKLEKAREQAAQRKLSKHLYYPEDAIRQGLEGEVRLMLKLDGEGRIQSADVAASSGHPILDRAALSAAYNMGSLPDAGVREFILPVVFRLQ